MPANEELSNAHPEQGTGPHIVVVGAGIVGANLALEFVNRGARVTVVDEKAPLAGASSASFAWLTNQALFRATDPVPEERARGYFNLHRLGLGAWRRLDARLGPELGVRWHGTIQWTESNPAEAARLTEELTRRQAWGSPSYAIDRQTICRLLPQAQVGEVEAAFYTPDEGTVNPFAAVRTVLRAACAAGATLLVPCRVVDFEDRPGGRVTVVHEEGRVDCDHVVLACGRKTPDLAALAGVEVPLVESTGHLLHLQPLTMFLDPLVLGPLVHALQRIDGRVILGRHFTGTPLTDAGDLDADDLLADATELFPVLQDARVETITAGRRIVPQDGLPIIGHSDERPSIHCVATNAGVSLGPVLAQMMVSEVLDGARIDVLGDYRADRFSSAIPSIA